MQRALKEIREAAQVEILEETERGQAIKIISEAEIESSKPVPDKGKIQKCLSSMAKWTGDRLTKAVDTAIEVATKYAATGPVS